MTSFRSLGSGNGNLQAFASPGDLVLQSFTSGISTYADGDTITAGDILKNLLFIGHSGDPDEVLLPTAASIYTNLAGSGELPFLFVGMGWDCKIANNGAGLTITTNAGITVPVDLVTYFGVEIVASQVIVARFIFENIQTPFSSLLTLTNGQDDPTFFTPLLSGPAAGNSQLTVGALVTGTGIPDGTVVNEIVYGPSGITGIVLSDNATTSGVSVVSFGPRLSTYLVGVEDWTGFN